MADHEKLMNMMKEDVVIDESSDFHVPRFNEIIFLSKINKLVKTASTENNSYRCDGCVFQTSSNCSEIERDSRIVCTTSLIFVDVK